MSTNSIGIMSGQMMLLYCFAVLSTAPPSINRLLSDSSCRRVRGVSGVVLAV